MTLLRMEPARARAPAAGAAVARSDAEQSRARSELLPQVTGLATYDRAFATEYDHLFDAAPEIETLPLGRVNTYRFSLVGNQLLFAGGRALARRRQASANHVRELRTSGLRKERDAWLSHGHQIHWQRIAEVPDSRPPASNLSRGGCPRCRTTTE